MRKAKIHTRASLNVIKRINNEQHEIANKQAEIKRQRQELRERRAQETRAFIQSAMDNFIDMMKNPMARKDYIIGSYSDDFTRHVNRHYPYNRALTERHANALDAYRLAYRELNESFIDALENSEDARDMVTRSGLKRIG